MLILVAVALPLFFALMALVVDGGNVLVHKRNIQVAADAAALAMAQSVNPAMGGSCDMSCQNQGEDYAQKNGIDVSALNPSWHQCSSSDPSDTNCWTYPYAGHTDQVEVRLHAPVSTFFVGAANALLHGGIAANFNVSARAVASTNPVIGVTTIPGQTFTGSTTTVPGDTHTVTDTSIISNGSGIAFAMSGACNSIAYSGAGSGTWNDVTNPPGNQTPMPGSASVLGALATNGGINFDGSTPKKVTWLGFDQPRCMNAPNHDPDSPPSGTNQCTARAWLTPPGSGTDADDSRNNCVQTLVNLNQTVAGQPWRPLGWPITPPTPPTPLPAGQTFNPSTDYPDTSGRIRCADPGTNVGNGWTNTHPAGVYCVSGTGTNLQFSSNGVDLTGGDGYTFFALNGATISSSGNGPKLKFYYPGSGCADPRPTTTRPLTYTCFGRTISNYDPETLLYSSFASSNGNCAICLQGQGGSVTGDIFATKPDPPPTNQTQTGGIVKVSGGGISAGQGFIECWNLQISGNTGTYQGTGAGLVIPGATHTTTDPSTTIIVPGSTGADTTVGTTIGTNLDLNE